MRKTIVKKIIGLSFYSKYQIILKKTKNPYPPQALIL